MIFFALIHKAKKVDVNTYKALMESAYGAVKKGIEVTKGETPIFKELNIGIID